VEEAMSEIVIAFPREVEGENGEDRAEAAAARLRQGLYLELRQVECSWHTGVLQLRGHVSSYYLRQIAQTLVQGLDGVEAIDNQLEVLPGRLPKNPRL
jgi:osmotically-inducible protein OsmY